MITRWLFLFIFIIPAFFLPEISLAQPAPTVAIAADADVKRGEDVLLTLTLDNTGNQVGYFPYFRFILPTQLSNATNEDSCGGLGTPTISTQTATTSIDPYNGETITLAAGQKVVFVVPPVAQMTPGQPAIACRIRVNATSAASFSVTSVRSIFAYGNSVNGEARACGGTGATLCSATTSTAITSRFAYLRTSLSTPTAYGTGPQSPVTINTTVDVAAGQTLTSVTLSDVLPDSFVISDPGNCSTVTVNPAPSTCTFTPNPAAANGGTLSLTYASLNQDVSVTYSGYIRRLGDSGTAIVNATTGARTTASNNVSFNSTQSGAITATGGNVTFQQRSNHVAKTVAVFAEAGGGKTGYSPGDTLVWTYQMAISDYFNFENVVINDTLQDGQTYVNGSLSLTVSEDQSDVTATENDLEAQGHLVITPAAGTTAIALDLGAAMGDAFFGFTDDILQGANAFGAADRATKVTITYRTTINESFTGAGGTVDAGDEIRDIVNSVSTNIVGQGAFSFGADLPLTTSAEIVNVTTYSQSLTHIDGAPSTAPHHIGAGDVAVFRLRITVPDGGGESFRLDNYLPGPVFAPPGGCLAYSASAPAALADGQWTFGTNQTSLVSGDITVSCDATEDRIRFDFADFDISAGTSDRVVEIYFAVTATTDPSEDGFEYANAAYFSYQDSSGATVATTLAGAGFISDTPNVVANFHNVTATGDTSGVITNGNLTGVDAGETVTFQTSLTNDGTGAAQDGILTLVWPAGLQPPSNPTACVEDSGTDCDYNVTDNGSCGAYDVTAADQTQLLVSNIDIAQGATCILTYQARVALSAQPAQLITTEAEYTWDNGGVTFSPVYDQATVTLRNPAITVTSITAPANPKPGDDIDVRVTITAIDGTSNSFLVDVVDNTFVTFDEASNSTLSMTLFTQTINATTYYCMINAATFVNNICFTNDPRSAANLTLVGGNLRVNFGQMVNGYADNTAQSVIFDLNNGIIDAAATSGNKTVRADYYWANPNGAGSLSVSSANSATAVYTPKLDVTKCVTAATTAAAPISMSEQVTYQVLMRNTGTFLQTAYDVANIVDTLTTGTKYVSGSLSAYYCTSGASAKTCANWTPAAAGCTAVVPVPTGDVSVPMLNAGGDPDIVADGYYHISFTADVSCDNVADSSGLDLAASHPDDDGINDACAETPMAYATALTNSIPAIAYSTQDGAGPNSVEGSYTTAASNTTSLTLDSDGDGIVNSIETNADADGDGVPNYLDTDSDDNGISDAVEASNTASPVDNEGDGIPDYRDLDDDGDGIGDSQEITDTGGTGSDTDGDGRVDFRDADSDGDGLSDLADGHLTNTDGAADLENAYDLDSDNDGIPDLIELGLGACDDGTGSGNPNDGVLHLNEIAACSAAAVCAASPCDSDGNGGIEADEFLGGVLPDGDSDGTPNYRDLDSDNDGLPDLFENLLGPMTLAAVTAIDANSNGFIEGVTTPGPMTGELLALGNARGNANGVIDITEALDTDGDGILNFLDRDSDGDGVPDIVENARYAYDSNGNNALTYGAAQEYNSVADPNLIGPGDLALIDTDSDGVYNYIDTDSDTDGTHDWIEAWTTNIDSNANGTISAAEFSAAVTGVGNADAYLTFTELPDTDSDGLKDMFDPDSDADTIRDVDETDSADVSSATLVSLWANVVNTEGAGQPDFRDTDSDGDGFLDSAEAGDAVLSTVPVDTDSDGTRDFQDLDSDGDGLNDVNEPTAGTSRTNGDSDGDACKDGCEIYGNAYAGPGVCSYVGKPWSAVGTLVSPITDPLDADTDNGGTSDCVEAAHATVPNPRAGNGADDPFQSDDPDGDGLNNAGELTAGTNLNNADSDGDGLTDGAEVLTHLTDPLDTDTDNGGVDDGVEIGLGKDPLNANDDDSDADGLTNNYEISVGLNPYLANSNGDCLNDIDEIGPDQNNPLDSDGDGLIDALELDNDGDGVLDCEELNFSSDPNVQDLRARGGGGGCGTIGGAPPPGGPWGSLLPMLVVLALLLGLRARPSLRASWAIALSFSLLALVTRPAHALDAQLFRPHAHNDGTYTLLGPKAMELGRFNYGVSYTYTQNPLAFGKIGGGTVDEIVSTLHSFDFTGAYQFGENWALTFSLPVHYLGKFEPMESSESGSDFGLGDAVVGAHYSLSEELGVLTYIGLPTGSEEHFVGEGAVRVGAKVLGGWSLGANTRVFANLGYQVRPKEDVYALQVGNSAGAGVGVARALSTDRMLEGIVEFYGSRPLGGASAQPENTPGELLVGVRKYSSAHRWDAGVGRGTTEGYGAPEWRAFFTWTWGPSREPYVPPAPPTPPPPPVPPEAPVAPAPKKLVEIKTDMIYFSLGKETIKKESYKALNGLIATLKKYPQILKLRIEGHTDDYGPRERNIELSKLRAKEVYDYLVRGGIAAERLEYEGYGPDRPIADNKTYEGQRANRRVEFKILESEGDLSHLESGEAPAPAPAPAPAVPAPETQTPEQSMPGREPNTSSETPVYSDPGAPERY